MPMGKGTYGSSVGRPSKKEKRHDVWWWKSSIYRWWSSNG